MPRPSLDLITVDPDSARAAEVSRWAEQRFDASLLILGDMTEALRPYSQIFAAVCPVAGAVRGLAARFSGFATPIWAVAGDNAEAIVLLCRRADRDENATMVVDARLTLPSRLSARRWSVDPWMVAVANAAHDRAAARVEALSDPDEILSFYAREGMHYWIRAMLQAGPVLGVRERNGAIVAAGAVNFALPRLGYAQLGSLFTRPAHRGRGYATSILNALRDNMQCLGVERVGLFADAASPELAAFYERRGFIRRGGFRFVEPLDLLTKNA